MPLTDNQRLDAQRATPRIVTLWRSLQPLQSCISFMNTGAHPDDETSSMLAVLGLRHGLRLSHACATRGEGGQNALGTEATRDLGTLRTREMHRAAEVLGLTQYWLSQSPDDTIFDFGFSKSGDETLEKWGEERTLMRFVSILRQERPDIVCPTFLDIAGQHGHHRAMTRSAFEAIRLAADPEAFPTPDLPVWQVKKLYLPAWSGAGDAYDDDVPPPPATVIVDASGSDPVLGADYAQIAQWSRGFHKTQGMGDWVEPGGAHLWPLHLAWSAVSDRSGEQSVTDNLPATLADLPDFADAPNLKKDLEAAGAAIKAAFNAFPDTASITGHVLTALDHIVSAEANCPDAARAEVMHRLAAKRRQLTQVIVTASDLRASLLLSKTEMRPGESLTLSLSLHAPGLDVRPELVLPAGWQATPWRNGECEVTVAADALPDTPYPDQWHPDRANSQLHVRLIWHVAGQRLEWPSDPQEKLTVLPEYSASLSSDTAILRISEPKSVDIGLSHVSPPTAKPAIDCPDGWVASHGEGAITLSPKVGLAPGLYEFPLSLDGNPASSVHRMHYAHTGPLFRSHPAVLRIRTLDLTLPDGHMGYIGGGSDRVDTLLCNVGLDIESLDDETLQSLDFSRYDTILVGIFAFRTRPALSHRLKDLHAWVASGGNLVTLYHRPWDNWQPEATPPAFLKIGKPSLRWRVTDENARVHYLQPDHLLLTHPNRIGPDDWTGWHKERGLYFAAEWDACYQPLLSIADRNEAPLTGALLSAQIGTGRHTHTSLILHHQMEKLVPGAYRLLANLLAPAKQPRKG
jgi:LmbE family N-acetylglucosaminyl deacetylase